MTRGWSHRNRISYRVVDEVQWMGLGPVLNEFRRTLALDPIRFGEAGYNLLNSNQCPFVKMWSPALCPKPRDWGPHIDVVGNFFSGPLGGDGRYTPPAELANYLAAGPPPIFVGAAARLKGRPSSPGG